MPRRKSASEWFELVAAWERSQLSAAAWCRQENIGYQSFLQWRHRRREFAPEHQSSTEGASFREVLSSETSVVTLEIGGIRLQLQRGFDPVRKRPTNPVLERRVPKATVARPHLVGESVPSRASDVGRFVSRQRRGYTGLRRGPGTSSSLGKMADSPFVRLET